MDEIRDQVHTILIEKSTESGEDRQEMRDELTKTIDDWERKSISQIQKIAEEARNDLAQYTTGRFNNLKRKLKELTDELQQGRVNKDFIETDLVAWKNKLNQLKEEVINPPPVLVREDYTKLIPKIRVNVVYAQEVFERSSGNADFEENGKVVYVKNNSDIYTEVRGKYEYTTGQHTLSFKVEELTGWILFGIISKSTPLQIHSYTSSSCYGWYNGPNFVYAAGQHICGPNNDVAQNDVVHLIINCDERLIRLTNERTNQTMELQIDLQKCPFPWQLHLNLNEVPTRVRII